MILKTKIILGVSLFFIVCCIVAAPTSVSARTSVRMKQVIHSVPCGVDHLTDGNGVDHYFAPRQCGKLIVAAPTPVSGSAAINSLPGGVVSVRPIYLDSSMSVNGGAGYLLLAQERKIYSFRLFGDNPLTDPRTFELTKVEGGVVTIRFRPDGPTITLKEGQYLKMNIAYDDSPDIGLAIKKIDTKGNVSLQIWFPLQERTVGSVEDDNHALFMFVTVVAFTSTVMYMHTQVISGRLRWAQSHAWHTL